MKTLFVDRKSAILAVDRGRLQVKIGDVRPHFSVPTSVLEMLVISASVEFSSTLMTRLTQEGVTVVFINPRNTECSTMTHGFMHNDAKRRLLQYRLLADQVLRLSYASRLVYGKLRGQKSMLLRALRKRPDCRYAITTATGRIDGMLARIPEVSSIDSLRGIEGAAGAAYFEAFQTLFAPALQFTCRNRRPPRDPVNAILSLTYTLLHAEAVRALFAIGFDPLLGIFHEPAYGRESLACDLVELFRPLADRFIWRLFADETLRPEHFTWGDGEGACLLGKRGREIFYGQYDVMARGCRTLMRRVARDGLNECSVSIEVASDGHSENLSTD